ncbi:MAG: cytidylate kinase, partial [Chloroflexi bacterium]|nr:cytidylate kinase [Chloroflexota bacterium]
ADASIKVYLTASAATRADRRTNDSDGNADRQSYQQVLQSIQRRDQIDSNREDSPLRPAEDAIIIPTDNLTAEEVVEEILALIQSNADQAAAPMIAGGQTA